MPSSIIDNAIDLREKAESLLNQSTTYSVKEEKIVRSKDLIVPIGCEDREYSTGLVTLNFGRTGQCILTSGGQRGAGKTCSTTTIFLDVLDNIAMHKYIIDPKWEFRYRKNPNFKFQRILSRMNTESRGRFNLKPKGHDNMVFVTPASLYRKEREDIVGGIHQLSPENMSYDDLLTILNLDPMNREDIGIIRRLDTALFGANETDFLMNISSKVGGFTEIKLPSCFEILKRLENVWEEVLKSTFKNLMMKQALGDGNIPEQPILDYLSEDKIVVFQTDFGKASIGLHPILASYVAKTLRDIIKDREAFIKGDKNIKLHYPISLYFGEYDVYYPNGKRVSTVPLIDSIYDNYRYAGLYLLGDTVHFHKVNPNSIEQSDFVFCFRPNQLDLAALSKVKKLSGQQKTWLEKLEFDKKMAPPAQMAVLPKNLNPDEMFPIVYPLPPMSEVQEEQKVGIRFTKVPEKKEIEKHFLRKEGEEMKKYLSNETDVGNIEEIYEKYSFEKDLAKYSITEKQKAIIGGLTTMERKCFNYLYKAMKEILPRTSRGVRETCFPDYKKNDVPMALRTLKKKKVVEIDPENPGKVIVYRLTDWALAIANIHEKYK